MARRGGPTLAGKLKATVVATPALTPATRDAMWGLFDAYYAGVERSEFEADLAPKHHVILLHDVVDGSLQGFSTLQVFDEVVDGRPFGAVFSGDTIVADRYWGQTALQRAFLSYVIRFKLRRPLKPVYWFLISKGYKTYLLLARNFPEHWPRYDRPTPPWQRALIDRLARSRYPDAWRPEQGVLSFGGDHGRLRAEVAPIDESLLTAPDVRFFHERNPGHAHGDELCCIGRVDARLWSFYMSKLARRWARRLAGGSRGERRA